MIGYQTRTKVLPPRCHTGHYKEPTHRSELLSEDDFYPCRGQGSGITPQGAQITPEWAEIIPRDPYWKIEIRSNPIFIQFYS